MADGSITVDDGIIRARHIHTTANIPRAAIAQRELAIVSVPLTAARTWDALATNLPATPANDDLGLVTGTWGTDAPYIGTGDLKTAGATTRRAGFFIPLPPDYEDGQTVTLRLRAGMKTTVADTSATIDAEVYRLDTDGTLGASDICATSATTINGDTTPSDVDFTITPTTLLKGDMLYVRVSIAVTDAATGTAVIGQLTHVELLCDLR